MGSLDLPVKVDYCPAPRIMFPVGVLKGNRKKAQCLVLGRQKILEQTRGLVLCPLGDELWTHCKSASVYMEAQNKY